MSTNVPTSVSGYSFPAVLEPVQVPQGYCPIEITQFWRGEYSPGHPLPLHWSISVRTSARRGNTHEIVGDTDTYATQDRIDVPLVDAESHCRWQAQQAHAYSTHTHPQLPQQAFRAGSAGGGGGFQYLDRDWRGSHVIGYVAPDRIDAMWTQIALVPVVRGRLSWNCQNWVYEALKALKALGSGGRDGGCFVDVENVRFEELQTHMMCLLDAWEMGDI